MSLRARAAAWLLRSPQPRGPVAQFAATAGVGDDELLRLFCDEAPAGLLVVDAAGRILLVNAALRGMLAGNAASATPGRPALALFAEDTRTAVRADLADVLADRVVQPHRFAGRLCREHGTAQHDHAPADAALWEATITVSAAALRNATGRVVGAVLHIFDITRQKHLEAQLAHGQKLQAVGQLAGGVAHDFNNLLTSVIGAADSIAARDGLDGETIEDVAQIRASADRGAALVRHLLAIGRQQTLQPRVLAVNAVITDLSGLLRRLLGGKVRLELALEDPGRHVSADPTQLDQVLVNLAVNARDAMPGGGVLTLRTGHRTLLRPLVRGPETVPPGRYVMFAVRDTGIGIAPGTLAHIFDPFFTTRRDQGGNGLGLSTVHGIVSQSGGFIEVESALGQGTEVRVYLPRHDLEEPAIAQPPTSNPPVQAAPAAEPVAVGAPTTARIVLLVDDEEPVLRLAERMLVRQGWRVLAATSGEAALALLSSTLQLRACGPADNAATTVSAMVADMVMPGMDGVALVRAVRRRLGAPDLPAILVSGYAEETLRRDLDSAGTQFLAKPYTLKELAAMLDQVARPAAPRGGEAVEQHHTSP